MAHLDSTSSFQKWILTDEEFLQGSILTITQKQCIQNQICDIAHRRLNVKIDVNNVAESAAEDAELAGQITALQYLLTLSNNAEDELKVRLRSGIYQPSGE